MFYIFLSVYLRIILEGNQLDAQFFSIICLFESCIDNKIIEQVNSFNYLGNMISYEKELDVDNKLHNYLKITGILNNVFRPKKLLRK